MADKELEDVVQRLENAGDLLENWQLEVDEDGLLVVRIPYHDLKLGVAEELNPCCNAIAEVIANAPHDLILLFGEIVRLRYELMALQEAIMLSKIGRG